MSGPTPPWSPFPVQDWASLPVDPLGPGPVDPAWPAPRPRRRWWVPLVVLTVVLALLSAGAYAASSVGVGASDTAARSFLPADGAVAYASVQTTRELRTTTGQTATESARTSGVAGLLSGDSRFVSQIQTADVIAERDTIQLWRTTTTPVADAAPTSEPDAQTVRLYRVDRGVELMGESGPAEGYVYSPALLELPTSVAPGDAWTGTGTAGVELTYRSALRAVAGVDHCLRVEGTITYASIRGGAGRVVNRRQDWCPGRGVVGSEVSFADLREVSRPVADLNRPRPATTDAPIAWSDPTRWAESSSETVAKNPTFGAGPMVGLPQSLNPVATASGLIVRSMAGLGDLLATRREAPAAYVSVWRAHPGGTVLTLTAYGDVLVATTSQRRMVAYSAAGVRLWSLELSDLAPNRPVRTGPDDLLLADLSGEVRRVEIATGVVRWRRSVGADVDVAPAIGAGLAVVMDRGGTTSALDLASGRARWTTDLLGVAATVVGDTVMILQDQSVHGLTAGDGRHRWVVPLSGTYTDTTAFAGTALFCTRNETLVLGPDGEVVRRADPFLRLTPAGDHLIGWGETEAVVFGRDKVPVTRWDLPALSAAVQDRWPVLTPRGPLLFGLDWTVQGWSSDD